MFRCVPHSLMDCVSKRARAARSKLCKVQIMFKQISQVTSVYASKFYPFVKIPPMQIVSKHSVLSKPVLRPFCLETIVYSPLPFFFLLPRHNLPRVARKRFQYIKCPLLFRFSSFSPWHNLPRAARKCFQCNSFSEEGRARSAENVSIRTNGKRFNTRA